MRALNAVSSSALLLGCGLLFGGNQAAADPIYQINFSATVGSGTLRDELSDGSQRNYTADLTGARISGTMTFDFGIAPPPVVSTVGQFLSTSIESTGGPAFMSEHVSLSGVTLPNNVLPMPMTFDLARTPPPPGAQVFGTPMDLQSFLFNSSPDSRLQALLPVMNISDQWTTPDLSKDRVVVLGLGIGNNAMPLSSSSTGIPSSWRLSNSAIGSSFEFLDFSLNRQSTDPVLHGVSANYFVSGTFSIESASGGFVTPEPGSIWLVVLPLAGMIVCWRRRAVV
jgi:hypothetical protein